MVCVTALYNVAVQVGTNRIAVSGSKFHYPMGRPDLPMASEKEWRLLQTKAILSVLEKEVEGVTVFSQQDLLP